MAITGSRYGGLVSYKADTLDEVADLFDEKAAAAEKEAPKTIAAPLKNRIKGEAAAWRAAANIIRSLKVEQ